MASSLNSNTNRTPRVLIPDSNTLYMVTAHNFQKMHGRADRRINWSVPLHSPNALNLPLRIG